MPDNISGARPPGDNKKHCSPWKQNVLTCEFQNYPILGKETTITQIECAFGVIESLCNLKFGRVFDGSQIMNIAYF